MNDCPYCQPDREPDVRAECCPDCYEEILRWRRIASERVGLELTPMQAQVAMITAERLREASMDIEDAIRLGLWSAGAMRP